MNALRFGVSRSSRQMQTRTARRERDLEERADAEEAEEIDSFFHYEEEGPTPYDEDWYAGPDPFFYLF